MKSLIYINTQEWLRLKFLQVVFFLALAYFGISYLLGSLSFAEQMRIKFDLGFAGIEIATMFVAIFLSTHALARDIDRKTFQVILARPIARWHLLIGYLGSIVVLNCILIGLLGLTMFLLFGQTVDVPNLIVSLVTILLKSAVVSAFGVVLGVIARPMFGLVLSFAYWILTYAVLDIEFFIKKINPDLAPTVMSIFKFTVPQFYLFNWKNYAFLTQSFTSDEVLWAWFHCFGWVFFLMFVASIFMQRKDIV